MATRAKIKPVSLVKPSASDESARLLDSLSEFRSREFVFAVVGYAGSGTTFVANQLRILLRHGDLAPETIKARTLLNDYAHSSNVALPRSDAAPIDKILAYQDLGDALRKESGENAAVAAYMIRRIHQVRGERETPPKVFILDSIKHPSEVRLLRSVYGSNFCLIGVRCRPDVRSSRLKRKLEIDPTQDSEIFDRFVNRDAEDSEHDCGQQVNDTFHLSDFFVDNTQPDEVPALFKLPDKLKRLTELLFAGNIHRPEIDERGLYHAHAASLRSSCLSRQVGAAIMDSAGNLLAVGCNDVPRHGGGLYSDSDGPNDDRCYKARKECSNTVWQLRLMGDILGRLKKQDLIDRNVTEEVFRSAIKGSRLGSLIEFSRSVHAEMDALMTLIREGIRLPNSSTLYSTTYPCHNCARHIVAAGFSKVVYLEPYAKSLAIDLHNDAIADNLSDENSCGKLIFEPYQGVSPRLYNRIFQN